VSRLFAALVLAVAAATGLVASPVGTSEVRAAAPGLTIVTDARYDVQPEAHRVRVTLDMVMTNRLSDTKTQRYYFDHAFLSVLPGASAPKLTWSGSGAPKATVSKATSAVTNLRLDFGARLYSGKSATYRLVFDIVDGGGKASRQFRIGDSLVSFPVWAFASDSTSGSTVRVVFPAGYQVQVASGDLPAPTIAADGTVVLQTGSLKTPLTFFAHLVADRQGAAADTTVATMVGDTPVALTVSSWAEDAAWGVRVGDLAGRALPVLAERIGLAWPRPGGLTIRETVGRSSGGYAGLFDPATGRIDVAYDASDEVVLHEAAHSWFNGSLLADRWAAEAFASYYARTVAPDLKVAIEPGADPDTIPASLEAARIPLNAWGALGDGARPTEDYAYAASLILARVIGQRVGDSGLRAVWADAATGTGAYQPPAGADGSPATAPETVDGPPDWRGLLDLLDEHATTSLDDLWRSWVARPEDLALLDARRAARARYAATVARAGEWQLPRPVRDAMRAWRFDDANRLLTDAGTILAERTDIAAGAAASGLTVPHTLQTAFQSPDGFATATQEAQTELEAIARYDAAVAARPVRTDMFFDVGLWGTSPQADLEAARTQFASGDTAAAVVSAGNAASAWTNAAGVGRGRLASLGVLLLAVLLAIVLGGIRYRGRRRARRSTMTAGGSGFAAADPYATLAATPDRVDDIRTGEPGARGAEPD